MIGEIFTPEEVGKKLKIPERAVKDLLRTGDLVGFKVGRFWRIQEEQLNDFIQRNSAGGREKPVSVPQEGESLNDKYSRIREIHENLRQGKGQKQDEPDSQDKTPS